MEGASEKNGEEHRVDRESCAVARPKLEYEEKYGEHAVKSGERPAQRMLETASRENGDAERQNTEERGCRSKRPSRRRAKS